MKGRFSTGGHASKQQRIFFRLPAYPLLFHIAKRLDLEPHRLTLVPAR
jgi:hypothetical protein